MIGHPISNLGVFPVPINWHMSYADMKLFENEQLERPYFDQITT